MAGVFAVAVQGALLTCLAIVALFYGGLMWQAIAGFPNKEEAV